MAVAAACLVCACVLFPSSGFLLHSDSELAGQSMLGVSEGQQGTSDSPPGAASSTVHTHWNNLIGKSDFCDFLMNSYKLEATYMPRNREREWKNWGPPQVPHSEVGSI